MLSLTIFIIVSFLSKGAYAGPELPMRDLVNDLPLMGARYAAMGGTFAANDNPFSDRGSFSMMSPAFFPRHAGKGSFSFHYTRYYEGLKKDGGIYQGSFTILSKKFWGESVFGIEGLFAESDEMAFPPSILFPRDFKNRYESRHKSIFLGFGKKIHPKFSMGIFGPPINESFLDQKIKRIGGLERMEQKFRSRIIPKGGSLHAVYSPWPNLQLAIDFILMRQNDRAKGDLINGKAIFTRRDRFHFGLGYFPDDSTSITFDWAYIDNHFPLDIKDRFNTKRFFVGFERWIRDKFALRFGSYDEAFTFGLGLRWRGINLDYAFADDWGVNDLRGGYGKSSETHLLTFTFKY